MFLPGDLSRHEVIRGRLVVVFDLCCTAWSIVAFLMVQYRIVALHRLTVFLVFYSVNTARSQVDFYKCCPGILPFSWRCCPGICHGKLVNCFCFCACIIFTAYAIDCCLFFFFVKVYFFSGFLWQVRQAGDWFLFSRMFLTSLETSSYVSVLFYKLFNAIEKSTIYLFTTDKNLSIIVMTAKNLGYSTKLDYVIMNGSLKKDWTKTTVFEYLQEVIQGIPMC